MEEYIVQIIYRFTEDGKESIQTAEKCFDNDMYDAISTYFVATNFFSTWSGFEVKLILVNDDGKFPIEPFYDTIEKKFSVRKKD